MKNMNESKNGFWGVLARKAKSIIEDDNVPQQSEMAGVGRSQLPGAASRGKVSLELYLNSLQRCCFVFYVWKSVKYDFTDLKLRF